MPENTEEISARVPDQGSNKADLFSRLKEKLPAKHILLIALVLFLIAVLGLAGFFLLKGRKSPEEEGLTPPPAGGERPIPSEEGRFPKEITVKEIPSTYKTASEKPQGWFTTGQEADITLSAIDFNDAGGPLLFNHPGGIASDGTRLLLADRNNNRVLIWNKLPSGNTPPDLVLGQKDFITNNPGTDLARLNWPIAVATDGKRVLVADTYNDRILIWNAFPTENGQPADLELKGEGNIHDPNVDLKKELGWPWAVWTDGTKLIVTSTAGASVLIWNEFPTENNQRADILLRAGGDFGTPRSIGSDGKHLIIGDHNAEPNKGGCGTFFWKTFPTSDDQPYDFFIASPGPEAPPPPGGPGGGPPVPTPGTVLWSPIFTPEGKVIALADNLYIWDSFPEDENDTPDLTLRHQLRNGDGSGMALVGGKLYLSLSNGNKIVGFNSFPTQADQKPDFAVGAPDIETDTLQTNFIISNPVPVSNGKGLFVSSDFDRKLYVWKNLPDESGARPDLVYSLPEGPWDNALFGNTLALAGRAVYIWKSLPTEGQDPDLILRGTIGNVTSQGFKGVALDEKYFYLADESAGKVYVWEGIPNENADPKFTLSVDQPTRLSSDGQYLAVTCTLGGPGGSVKIYRVDNLSNKAQPTTLGGIGTFNLPQGAIVSHDHLFVGDTGFNRVHIWEKIEDALAGKDPDVLLGTTEPRIMSEEAKPQIGKNKLFWPAVPAFDGSYLWVGEFKFSERLLRFSVR